MGSSVGAISSTQPPIRQFPAGENGRGKAIGQLLQDITNGTINTNFKTVTRNGKAVTTKAQGMLTLAGDKQTVPYEVTYTDQSGNGLKPGDYDVLSVRLNGLIFTMGNQQGQPTSHVVEEKLSAWKENNVGPSGQPYDSGRPGDGGGYTVHNTTTDPDYFSIGSYQGVSLINPTTQQPEHAIEAIPKALYDNFAPRVLGDAIFKPR
jgi:hypothetical protein